MKSIPIIRSFSAVMVAAILGWTQMGCGTTADLEPAPSTTPVPGMEDAARTSVDGVNILTQTDEWTGAQPIHDEVTPIRMRIENNSGQPITVQYDKFALVDPTGERYSALPPFRIEGTVDEPVMATTYTPISEPAFVYDRFEVAPVYSSIYPGLTPFADPFYYDRTYYDDTFTYWGEVALPTDEMLVQALPEGVVNDGGYVEGWVYFQRVPTDISTVTLRADVVNPRTNDEIGEIEIPYDVR